MYTCTHTHPHAHKKKDKGSKELPNGIALAGPLTMPLTVVWAPEVELHTASSLVLPQPKPGPKYTILLGPGLVAKWKNWWNLNL